MNRLRRMLGRVPTAIAGSFLLHLVLVGFWLRRTQRIARVEAEKNPMRVDLVSPESALLGPPPLKASESIPKPTGRVGVRKSRPVNVSSPQSG